MEYFIANFEELQGSVIDLGIYLSYCSEQQHDRFIASSNGWKIILGEV